MGELISQIFSSVSSTDENQTRQSHTVICPNDPCQITTRSENLKSAGILGSVLKHQYNEWRDENGNVTRYDYYANKGGTYTVRNNYKPNSTDEYNYVDNVCCNNKYLVEDTYKKAGPYDLGQRNCQHTSTNAHKNVTNRNDLNPRNNKILGFYNMFNST